MIQNSNENKHIIQAYRQLVHKLRFLGKNFDLDSFKSSFLFL
jgi:hypothetical protein